MNQPVKQHLIDPEVCIRCHSCEAACEIGAISHDDNNVVVEPGTCNFCMDCIPVCPTGSIDNWRVVTNPYTLEEQFGWTELPDQEEFAADAASGDPEAFDEAAAALLAEAHRGDGGKARAPASSAKPSINMYTPGKPALARVQGSYRLTNDPDHDVRHVILDFGSLPFPVLEGQCVGIIPPGADGESAAHSPRLYSVSSPRDGERANYGNVSLTVKREKLGLCSNYVCDLEKGDEVRVTGPFGATFLMPDDPEARLLMICTGTGAAPMRAFVMRRQRAIGGRSGGMLMFFGARSRDALPYFGPLSKVPSELLERHLVYSREGEKEYVQNRMAAEAEKVAEMLADPRAHVYVCGLRGMEEGVERAFADIAEGAGLRWDETRDAMLAEGRYHVETY